MGNNKDNDLIGMIIAGGIGLLAIIFGKNLFGGHHSSPSTSSHMPPSLPPTPPNISAYNAKSSGGCGCGL